MTTPKTLDISALAANIDAAVANASAAVAHANALETDLSGDESSYAASFAQNRVAIKANAALAQANHEALVGIQAALAEIKQAMGGTPPVVVSEPDLGTLPAPASTQKISVNGKDFVDADGNVVVPRGVNFSGFAFVAVQGWSPADPSGGQGGQPNGPKYSAITDWGANVIRFDLNEASWLGYSCTDTDGVVHNPDPGGNYKSAVKTQVEAALAAGLYVILDLHWTAPGTTCPMLQTQMADADHSLDFWASIANTFKNYHGVMFELFNEPFLNVDFSGDPWAYMMEGAGGSFSGYPATSGSGNWKDIKTPWDVASYQAMIDAVRATGATNVVLVGTMQYSQDFSRWLASKPTDPLNQMAAAFHPYPTYGAAPGTPAAAQPNFAPQVFTDAQNILAAGIPVIATETGDHNALGTVGSPLVSTVTQWADANGVGVLGWTWDVWPNPDNVLIKDVNGTPTDGYGQVFKAWLESHKVSAPPVVTLVGQTLTATQDTFSVGDTFAVIGTLNYSDGSSGPVSTYRLYGFDTAVLQQTGEPWEPTFTAVGEGSTTIRNDNNGTTGTLEVAVEGVGNPPRDTSNDPAPPTSGGGATPPTSGGSPPPPTGPITIPDSPPPPPEGKAHTVKVEIQDIASREEWSTTATVGEDWTVSGQYKALKNGMGVEHPGVVTTIYSDCVDVGATRGDNAVDFTNFALRVSYDGVVIHDLSPVDFWRGCWNKTLRYGPQAPWHAVDPSLFPNWAKGSPALPDFSEWDFSYNGIGAASYGGAMGTAGDRGDIGYVPVWDVPFCVEPSDAAFALVRQASDSDGAFAICWIDPETGQPYDITKYPHVSTLSTMQVNLADNPVVAYNNTASWGISGSPSAWDGAHQTGYSFVAASATGTARDLAHVAIQANAPLMRQNPRYRKTGVFQHNQERRTAWALRSIFIGAHLSSMTEYFTARLEDQRVLSDALPRNTLHFMATSVTRESINGPNSSVAVWEENYVRIVLDVIADKNPEWKPSAAYLAGGIPLLLGRNPGGNPNTYAASTDYTQVIKTADGSFMPDVNTMYFTTLQDNGWSLEDAQAFTAPGVTMDEVYALLVKNKTSWYDYSQKGDLMSYGRAPGAYPALMRAAAAGAMNAGVPNGDDCWALMESLPTKPDFSKDWRFNIIPGTK